MENLGKHTLKNRRKRAAKLEQKYGMRRQLEEDRAGPLGQQKKPRTDDDNGPDEEGEVISDEEIEVEQPEDVVEDNSSEPSSSTGTRHLSGIGEIIESSTGQERSEVVTSRGAQEEEEIEMNEGGEGGVSSIESSSGQQGGSRPSRARQVSTSEEDSSNSPQRRNLVVRSDDDNDNNDQLSSLLLQARSRLRGSSPEFLVTASTSQIGKEMTNKTPKQVLKDCLDDPSWLETISDLQRSALVQKAESLKEVAPAC